MWVDNLSLKNTYIGNVNYVDIFFTFRHYEDKKLITYYYLCIIIEHYVSLVLLTKTFAIYLLIVFCGCARILFNVNQGCTYIHFLSGFNNLYSKFEIWYIQVWVPQLQHIYSNQMPNKLRNEKPSEKIKWLVIYLLFHYFDILFKANK